MAKKLKQQINLIGAAAEKFYAGELDAALGLCKTILKNRPNDVDALNLSGIIYDKLNNKNQAAKLFQAAIKVSPNNAELCTNLATTYLDLEQTDDAEKYLTKAIRINPSYTEALYHLGNICYRRDKADDAKHWYEQALATNPRHIRVLNNLADVERKQGNTEKAISLYEQVLSIAPDFVEPLLGLASIKYDNQEYETSVTLLKRLLSINPDHARANYLLGVSLFNIDKNSPEIFNHLQHSLSLDVNQADVNNAIAAALHHQNENEKALDYLHAALQNSPNFSDAYNTQGIILHELGRIDEAKLAYEKAIELKPDSAEALNNYGHLLGRINEPETAIPYFLKAIEAKPDHISAKSNLALYKLLLGKYTEGWDYYRFRPSVQQNDAAFCLQSIPDDFNGKSVLFVKDQGIGDELFFLRFLPKFIHCGAIVSYHCCHKLLPLLARTGLFHKLSFGPVDKTGFDYVFSVGDLPYLCHHHSPTETPEPFQLTYSTSLLATIEKKLQEFGPPPYIGFSWQAGGLYKNKKISSLLKTLDMNNMQRLLAQIPGTLVSLQRKAKQPELDQLAKGLARPILNLDEYNDDLERMLCVLQLLDHYIAVSNTNIHMRAGLGKKSHVLIPSPPEWRWMQSGKTVHWFPHCQVYRQGTDKNWNNTIEELVNDLG